MIRRVAIVDYGMGNLDSVARAVQECGGAPIVTNQARDLEAATRIVLPGDGAFAVGMRTMRRQRLDEALAEQVLGKHVPFLGVCLGMQLLAEKGWEDEEADGLGWIPGETRRLEPGDARERIPHVGWNEVTCVRASPLFREIPPGKDFYFLHSYHLICRDEHDVVARTPYCGGFVAAVSRENIFGVQFHPEKSQGLGFQVLKNFLAL